MKDNVGYIVFRTAARDPVVFGNGNGPLRTSSMRALRDLGSYSGDINHPGGAGTQELPGLWPFIFHLSPRHQASSDKLQAPSTEVQASSRKLQAPRSLNQGTDKYFFQQV